MSWLLIPLIWILFGMTFHKICSLVDPGWDKDHEDISFLVTLAVGPMVLPLGFLIGIYDWWVDQKGEK